MKKSLLLYLFILAVLMNIFTYAYFSRKNAAEMKPLADQSAQVKKLQDSVGAMQSQMGDANYFSLENDQNAQEYIVDNGLDQIIPYEKFVTTVTDQLMAYNDKPEGNPYTGQNKLTDNKFIINKAKILNHRWIVADYSDGQYWGEVFIKYFVNPDKTVSFEVVQSILYQK